MKSTEVYLHINTINLPHIYVAACIKPAGMIERRETDLQSLYPEHILLSHKKWSSDYDCSVRIVLSTEELTLNTKKISNDYFLYDSLIPISRITQVNFSEYEKAKSIVWNIRNGAGFIADTHIVFCKKNKSDIAALIKPQIVANLRFEELKRTFSKYNKLLGGLAFLRIALKDIYDTNINYPINYIATISYFNDKIKEQLTSLIVNKNFRLHTFFTGEASILKYLAKDITADIIERTSFDEKIQLIKKFGLTYDLKSIPVDSLTYYLCILSIYGKGGSKSLEDFIISFFNDENSEKNEPIALTMGIHIGYESLRNFYRLQNRDLKVKFDLESKLDYYLIESVFYYLKNQNNIAKEFNFIDSLNFSNRIVKQNAEYIQYSILDTLISVEKRDNSEYFANILRSLVDDIAEMFHKDFIAVNKQKLFENFHNKYKKQYAEIANEIISETKQSYEITIKDLETKMITHDKNSSHIVTAKPKKIVDLIEPAKIVIQEESVLFEESDDEIILNKQLINMAKTKEILVAIAKKANIDIPRQISKKDDIKKFLLDKCSEQ
jgi:hypothetical protein